MIFYITLIVGLVLAWNVCRAMFHPGVALALMWSLYPAEQLLQQGHPIFIQASSVMNFLFTGVCLVAVINGLRLGKYRGWRIPPESTFCIGLFVFAWMTCLWSISQKVTFLHLSNSAPYTIAYILVAPLCLTDEKQLRLAINTTIFMGALILLGHAFSGYGSRGVALMIVAGKVIEGNPLAVASYGGYVGVCALFSVYGRKFSPLVALKIAIFVLSAYVIIKSSSRGQLVALVAVSFIWLPVIAKATLKRSTIVAILGSAVIVFAAIYTYSNLLEGTGRWKAEHLEVASVGRFEMATRLLDYWVDKGPFNWLVGLGNSSSYRIVGFYPHNVPAEVLAEEGLIGFALLAAFVFSVLFRSGKMMFSADVEIESRVNLGILMAIFCFEGILTLKQGSMIGNVGWFSVGMTIGWLGERLKAQARKSKYREFVMKRLLFVPSAEQLAHGRSNVL